MIDRIVEPGLYALSPEAYHADPCELPSLSASIAKAMLTFSPAHAWHAHPRLNPTYQASVPSAEMQEGTVLHWMLLGAGRPPLLVDAGDWRTNAAKDRRLEAQKHGRVAILRWRYRELRRVAAAVRRELRATIDVPEGVYRGVPEAVLVWREGEMWCRCMIDWLPTEMAEPPLIDLKFTTRAGTAEQFSRSVVDHGYDLTAAWYRRGFRAVFKREPGPYVFLNAETAAPNGVSRIVLGPEFEELGDSKVEAAIETWNTCIRRNDWPSYPRRLITADAPRYASQQWEAQSQRGTVQIRDGSRKTALAVARAHALAARLGAPIQ